MPAIAQREAVKDALAWLERRGTKRGVKGMARYGITASKARSVSMRFET